MTNARAVVLDKPLGTFSVEEFPVPIRRRDGAAAHGAVRLLRDRRPYLPRQWKNVVFPALARPRERRHGRSRGAWRTAGLSRARAARGRPRVCALGLVRPVLRMPHAPAAAPLPQPAALRRPRRRRSAAASPSTCTSSAPADDVHAEDGRAGDDGRAVRATGRGGDGRAPRRAEAGRDDRRPGLWRDRAADAGRGQAGRRDARHRRRRAARATRGGARVRRRRGHRHRAGARSAGAHAGGAGRDAARRWAPTWSSAASDWRPPGSRASRTCATAVASWSSAWPATPAT